METWVNTFTQDRPRPWAAVLGLQEGVGTKEGAEISSEEA